MYATPFVCMLVIIISGLVFNTAAILSICSKRGRMTFKDEVIFSLCISNLIQSLLSFTIQLDALYIENISSLGCSMESFLKCFCTYAAIAHFVILCFERYLSIVYPYLAQRWFPDRCLRALLLIAGWVYGLVFSLPPLLGVGSYRKTNSKSTYCFLSFEEKFLGTDIFVYTLLLFNFIIPLGITVVIYILIIRDLRKAVEVVTRTNGRGSIVSRSSQKNVRTQIIALLWTIFIYIFLWMPLAVVICLTYRGILVSPLTESLTIYFSKFCTVVSPVVFCLIERQFWKFVRDARRSFR